MEFGHAQWRTSSFTSETADCVEIAYPTAGATVGIRDSKDRTGGHLTLPASALHHLTGAVTRG